MSITIQEAIRRTTSGTHLTLDEATDIFNVIMSGSATSAQIAALIVALRMKGETPDEITGAAAAMREKATHISTAHLSHVVDTCGTGGDGAFSFNISTAAAFVAAGAGAVVAKHGNRSVSSKCGSADVLEVLGVGLGAEPPVIQACIDDIGICFLFAQMMQKAMKYAGGPRKEIGIRTIFNILGPLTNPANAPYQLLGVFSPDLTEPMARVLLNLGIKKAYIVHGMDKLDEISICAPTRISELSNGLIRTYTIQPEDFGFSRVPHEALIGGTAAENAGIIRTILEDTAAEAQKNIVLLNAGFALAAAEVCDTPKEGIELAKKSISSGAANNKLHELVKKTNQQ
jgi:anthranilate phosphoribosyltransferase